jgi:hypothetical protein
VVRDASEADLAGILDLYHRMESCEQGNLATLSHEQLKSERDGFRVLVDTRKEPSTVVACCHLRLSSQVHERTKRLDELNQTHRGESHRFVETNVYDMQTDWLCEIGSLIIDKAYRSNRGILDNLLAFVFESGLGRASHLPERLVFWYGTVDANAETLQPMFQHFILRLYGGILRHKHTRSIRSMQVVDKRIVAHLSASKRSANSQFVVIHSPPVAAAAQIRSCL